jgi:putative inorganic carbon (hco3(-)) transporter
LSFALTLAYVVMVFIRPQEWLVPWLYDIPVLDVVGGLAVLAFLIDVREGRIQIPKNPQMMLVGGVWFASCMSHVVNTYFAGLIATIPLVSKTCAFSILLICLLDRPSRIRIVLVCIVAMACLMAWNSLLQDRRGYGFAYVEPYYVYPEGGGAPYARTGFFGIFADANDLAQLLIAAIPLSFAVRRKRGFFGFLLGCAITWLLVEAFITTHSRGGLVALVTAGGVMVCLLLPVRWFPTLMTFLLIGALIMCPAAAGLLHMDESAHDRVIFWGYANRAFKQHPLFGIGTNMFAELTNESRAAHNSYVLCYTELGFFGYWFWFGLILLAFLGAWRVKRALARSIGEEEAWLRRAAGLSIASLAGYCASAYFLSRSFLYPTYIMLAMVGALPVAASRFLPEEHPPLIRPGKDLGVTNTIAAAVSIAYIYVSVIMLNHLPYDR